MKRLVFLVLFAVVGFKGDLQVAYYFEIKPPESELFGHEDLMGRLEFEQMMTADPETGQIPEGIQQAEFAFTGELVRNTSQYRTQELNIESAGPSKVGGRTRAVAFDIRDERTILAGGVSGGIWKSTDGGQTWVRKSNPLNRNSISCLVQDIRPGHEDTWYHGTGEFGFGNSASVPGVSPFRGDGIFKSTDNGESWTLLPSTSEAEPNRFTSQFQYVFRIIVNRQNMVEDELLAATFGGIVRSVDGGATWESVIGPKQFGLPDTVDLNDNSASFYTDIAQSATGVYYATLSTEGPTERLSEDAGIYISRNGTDWLNIIPLTEESRYERIVIGNSESNPEITYFLVDTNPVFILQHTLQQFDDNDTIQFFDLRETPNFGGRLGDFNTQPSSYNMMIRVHPENPDIVFTGGTNLYRSTDGFRDSENSKWVGGYDPSSGDRVIIYEGHHPDQHDLLFFPSNPDKILSANDGGLRVSEDGTADSVVWSSINNGFVTSQYFTIAQSKIAGDPLLIGGLQDNGTYLTSNASSRNWLSIIGGDGGYTETTRNNQLWYASFQRGQTLRITFNEDFDETSFARVDPGGLVEEAGSGFLFINPFILDPLNENRMFIAGGNHLYFNANVSQIPGGTQEPASIGWERVTERDTLLGAVSALEISADSEVLYFGTSGGQLFKIGNASSNRGFIVEEITRETFPESSYISCISVNPADPNQLLVIFSNYNVPSVFVSDDGGRSFIDVSGNLEENPDGTGNGPSARWAEIIPTTSGELFVLGTSTGLFSTPSLSGNSTVWVREAEQLIGSAVVVMMDYRPVDGNLAIATHGNGVFTTQIQDFETVLPGQNESDQFSVDPVFPNPFATQTQIQYEIPEDGIVKVDLYTIEGALIKNLLWAPQFAGVNRVVWDGTNATGTPLNNGVYFYRVQYNDQYFSGRVALQR